MDTLQLQAAIEQVLTSILNQGPDAIAHLTVVLQMIVNGAKSLGLIATIIAKTPIFVDIANQLLILISSGSGIPEIAAALAEFAATLGISDEALIQLLQMIGGFLLMF